jgi:hypothetical protein
MSKKYTTGTSVLEMLLNNNNNLDEIILREFGGYITSNSPRDLFRAVLAELAKYTTLTRNLIPIVTDAVYSKFKDTEGITRDTIKDKVISIVDLANPTTSAIA